MKYINVVGYCFEPLTQDRKTLQKELKDFGVKLDLRGTLLLAPEGINVTSVAGEKERVEQFLNFLIEKTQIPAEKFDFKESLCDHKPFSRFLVRLKKEIIAFDFPFSEERKAQYIEPEDLETLMDDPDNEVCLLDTRNDYEIELGTFKGAVTPPISTFKEFKGFAQEKKEELKEKTVVTFCTGGIRCEKAATYLKDQGYKKVYQLHGGILRYFEKTKAKHYEGECFVFDKRVSVKKDLLASDKKLCYGCRGTLMPEDLKSPHYKKNEYCPQCFEHKELKEHAS